MYKISGNWVTSTGWCVDVNGLEDGRSNNLFGYGQTDCFKLCERNYSLNGCTFLASQGKCVTYSGSIVAGNGNGAYKCYRRTGK